MFKTVTAMLHLPVFSYEKHVDWKLSLFFDAMGFTALTGWDRNGMKFLFVVNAAPLALQLCKNRDSISLQPNLFMEPVFILSVICTELTIAVVCCF